MTSQGRRATPVNGARWAIKGKILDTFAKFSRIVYNIRIETIVKTAFRTIC